MTKVTAKKPRLSLLPWSSLREIAALLTVGAEEHGDDPGGLPGWRRMTPDQARREYLDAAMRHLAAVAAGEDLDHDSGRPAITHLAASILILHDIYLREREVRPSACNDV